MCGGIQLFGETSGTTFSWCDVCMSNSVATVPIYVMTPDGNQLAGQWIGCIEHDEGGLSVEVQGDEDFR